MSLSKSNSIYKNSIGCLAACALLTGTVSADAQTQPVTKTKTFTINAPLIYLATPPGGFSLPDFDSSLGTLQSVNVTLGVNNWFHLNVDSSALRPEAFTNASASATDSITGPGGLTLDLPVAATVGTGVAHHGTNSFEIQKNPSTTPPDQQTITISGDSLSDWQDQAKGLVHLKYTKGNATFDGNDVGNDLCFSGSRGGTGAVTVEYTYITGSSPVMTPEPGAKYLAALAAAAMALLLAGRRRLLGC